MKFYVPVVGFTAFLFFLSVYPSSNAQEWWDDGMTIEQVASSIDNESRKLGGTKIVAAHLKRQFQINDDVIYSLREKRSVMATSILFWPWLRKCPAASMMKISARSLICAEGKRGARLGRGSRDISVLRSNPLFIERCRSWRPCRVPLNFLIRCVMRRAMKNAPAY